MKARKLGPLGPPLREAPGGIEVQGGRPWWGISDASKILYLLGVKHEEIKRGIDHPILRDHPHRDSCDVLYFFGSLNLISKLQDHVIALSRAELDVQNRKPVLCTTFHKKNRRKNIWVYQHSIYEASPLLEASDAETLIKLSTIEDKEKLERLKKLSAALETYGRIDRSPQRRAIPSEVQTLVWTRDNGQCCKCGSSEDLQYDHVIPVEKGGGNTEKNIQLLCGSCNRRKSNRIGY